MTKSSEQDDEDCCPNGATANCGDEENGCVPNKHRLAMTGEECKFEQAEKYAHFALFGALLPNKFTDFVVSNRVPTMDFKDIGDALWPADHSGEHADHIGFYVEEGIALCKTNCKHYKLADGTVSDSIPAYPLPETRGRATLLFDGLFYVTGGRTESGVATREVRYFDSIEDKIWKSDWPALPDAVSHHCMASWSDTQVAIVGGYGDASYTAAYFWNYKTGAKTDFLQPLPEHRRMHSCFKVTYSLKLEDDSTRNENVSHAVKSTSWGPSSLLEETMRQ